MKTDREDVQRKADLSGFQKNASAVCWACLVVFAKHNACSTQPEQSERKANSFKIDGEITRNWRPFKNIITSLFPQQGVQDWGSFLIRTADEIAIKPLSQTHARFTQCASASVKSFCQNAKINNSGRGRIIKSPVSLQQGPVGAGVGEEKHKKSCHTHIPTLSSENTQTGL